VTIAAKDLLTDPTQVAELARKHWHTFYALLLTEFLSLTLLTGILAVIIPALLTKAIAYLVVGAIIFISWLYTNRLPTTRKNKVGFVISISTGDEIERKRIMEDFVLTLHELVKAGQAGRSFQLIELPEHLAEKIVDAEAAQEMRAKCRAHFMIYGRVRLRSIAGKQEHLLHLDGMVVHNPMPTPVGEGLTREFTELLPRRLRINTENDVISFAFTSEWINCVSKYIIGIAAFCSGAVDYAEILQNDVNQLLEVQDKSFPIYAKLKQRLPWRLTEINLARATVAYNRWLKTRDAADMLEMGRDLEKIPQACIDDYNVIVLRSIFLFVQERNVRAAMAKLKKCKKVRDSTWLYSLGFLHAYSGNLKSALQCYREAMTRPLEPMILAQIEEFLCWIIDKEPEQYQLYYCFGYINWKIKEDGVQAIKDFETFLALGNTQEYAKERELAHKWISEIKGPAG